MTPRPTRVSVAACASLVLLAAAPAAATLTKVTTGDIVTIPAWYGNGSWGDYGDDGYLDLFVGSDFRSTTNSLYHSNRDGAFTLIDPTAILRIPSEQHGAAWADYDNDGHLDLVATGDGRRTAEAQTLALPPLSRAASNCHRSRDRARSPLVLTMLRLLFLGS